MKSPHLRRAVSPNCFDHALLATKEGLRTQPSICIFICIKSIYILCIVLLCKYKIATKVDFFFKGWDKNLSRYPNIFFPQANGSSCVLPGVWPFQLRDHCWAVMSAAFGAR